MLLGLEVVNGIVLFIFSSSQASPTDDMGKLLSCLHNVPIEGEAHVASGVQIAQLALKHRRNKHGRQCIILFIGSPVMDDVKSLVKVCVYKGVELTVGA